MTIEQPEALRLAAELDDGYPLTGDAISAAAELRRQHARITELESQLAQRFDAADMATASAQGFRDGVASVSAGSEPVAWREHVEQRLLTWRQSFVNRSGDQLALDDFMDKQSLDDLIDFVCDEWALSTHPSPPEGMVAAKEQQAGWISVNERLPEPTTQPAPVAPTFPLLAKPHTGMRVDYLGLLGQCRRVLRRADPGNAEMLRQLQGHLQELGQRWYSGDTAAVDEILQMYCIEQEARAALAQAKEGGAA